MSHKLPPFSVLPLRKDGPPKNAWGLFGDNDSLGRLNLLTPEVVKTAAQQIRTGQRISLDWPLNKPSRPFFGRQPFYHHIDSRAPSLVNDDIVVFNTQCSTQWDGLRHFARNAGYQQEKLFYNGTPQEKLASGDALGINIWVEHGGIIGRGVLLDYASWAAKKNIVFDAFSRHTIPIKHLQQIADEEGIEFRQGDILFVRSGFTAQYDALTSEQAANLSSHCMGLESSPETAQWLWEKGFAAVASDAPSFEQTEVKEYQACLHEWLLAGWGMPIGEMFYLEKLAEELRNQGRCTFFLTSVPLKIPGGVASPPNAMAIL